jgi:hypothetical protein
MSTALKDVRDRVLTENTAQAVFKHLDHFEDNRSRFQSRWVWELLQNARDAAPPGGVDVDVALENDALIFRHNGQPFTADGITHLIYHGSTKVDKSDAVGHFGSGFISTHLLSRVVSVSGFLDSGERFAFDLDRSGETVEALRAAMDASWAAFGRSIETPVDASQTQLTEFVYPLREGGLQCCQAGVEDLERSAALVLAFCPEIRRISIRALSSVDFERTTSEESDFVSVACSDSAGRRTRRMALMRNEDLQTAVPLAESPEGPTVALPDNMPRVFIVFPLLDTASLLLPGIINSMALKPHEDRNGLVLDGETEGAVRNRALLSTAAEQMVAMLNMAVRERWSGTCDLLAFHGRDLPSWGNQSWFDSLVVPIVKHARKVALLPTRDAERIPPAEAWVPVADSKESRLALWDLSSKLRESHRRLPLRADSEVWARNLANWARLLNVKPTELSEAWTMDRLAKLVSDASTLDGLTAILNEGEEATTWLSAFLRMVQESKAERLFDSQAILPSQAGRFRKRPELRWDDGIAEDLKDIGHALGLDVRAELLHVDIALSRAKELLGARTEADVLGNVIERFRHCCQNHKLNNDLVNPGVALLWWIADRESYHERLAGLPVATDDAADQVTTTVELRGDPVPDRAPLAPAMLWPERARSFELLFAPRHKIAKCYAEKRSAPESWRLLARLGYVRTSPLYQTERQMEVFIPDAPLPEGPEEVRHRAASATTVTAIAFLDEGDGAIVEKARKSRKSALELVRFVLDFALELDGQAFEEHPTSCECGEEHRIFRAAWLVPLRERAWIPPGAEKHGSERPTAESLARLLLGESDLVQRMLESRAAPFLHAIGVSPPDFALRTVATDEDGRVSLIQSMGAISEAAGGDLERVRQLASELREHPEIIAAIEQQKVVREKVHRNQEIGALVEQILKQELEGHGFTVKRTGVGSDFEVESDFIEQANEVWLELQAEGVSTLLEVKSTRENIAKMTPTQAGTACANAHRFALCVVSIDEEPITSAHVRANSRFLFEIGAHLLPLWTEFQVIRGATEDARQRRGPVELEMIDGQTRFRIDRSLWDTGHQFNEAIVHLADSGRSANKT